MRRDRNKQSKNPIDLSGLPTALLYLVLFAIPVCLGVFVFALFTGVFFWVWLLLCKWSFLASALPSKGARFGVGLLIYLLIAGAAYIIFRKSEGRAEREAARLRQKETASRQRSENDHAQNKEAAPVPQNQPVPAARGKAPPPHAGPEVAVGTQAAAVTQDTREVTLQTGLRFDGVYVAAEDAGEVNGYVAGGFVTWRQPGFLRFYPNGRVCATSREVPVTASAQTLLTPEEAFVQLGQLEPARSDAYIFTGDNLSFQVGAEAYQVTPDGLSLQLTYYVEPDPYGNSMGDVTLVNFAFVEIA